MSSFLSDYEYDIFISYRHNDNRSGWVTEFVKSLQEELASTIKDPVSVYFDSNPHDGLLETHNVDKSLEGKLKCLIFIPIISQTYCDTKGFAWRHEFVAFNKIAREDQFGRDIKLNDGNVTSRILPVKIHDLDTEDKALLENELMSALRAVDFIYKEPGVNRPLKPTDNKNDNQNRTDYRNQVNKIANAIKEIITGLKNPLTQPLQPTKNRHPPTKPIRSNRTWIAISILLLLGITGYFLYPTLFSSDKEDEVLDKSIAVLPFVNMSNDPDQEYFSDGLSEELLNLLSKIPELKVIGRTSSFSFKGKDEDLRMIGEKLGVAHILEGSVQKEGNKIRVTAQLIKAADGSHLWSERYERDLEGIFKLQDDIAGAVVKQLKLKLLTAPSNAASSTNIEVHNLILQGNYFYDKLDKESVSKALDFYLQALTIDSLDANTWAKVARVFSRQAWQNYIDRNEGYEKARNAAAQVIILNDKLAIGYLLLGDTKMNHDFDWDGADAEFQKAHKLEPGNADVLNDMGVLSAILGDWEEAIRLFKQAIALDPLQLIFYSDLGNKLTYSNQLEEAIVQFNKILELNPQFQRAHLYLGRIYLLQGKPEMALAEMQQENMEIFRRFGLALAYHALGRKNKADEELTNFITIYQNDWPFLIAEIYAFRGAKDKAFEWLEKAYKRKDPWLTWLNGDPFLKNLEGDPRHKAFLKKMKLPV